MSVLQIITWTNVAAALVLSGVAVRYSLKAKHALDERASIRASREAARVAAARRCDRAGDAR